MSEKLYLANVLWTRCEAAEAHIERLEDALRTIVEWLPIETAPRDGTEVVATGFLYNDPRNDRWTEVAACRDGIWYWSEGQLYEPTHWLPLPALSPSPKATGDHP